MANEITIQVSLTYAKTGITTVSRKNPTAAGDVLDQKSATLSYVNRVQNIGAAAEAIGLGDVTTPGFGWFHNIGTTDTIFIRNGVAGANVVALEIGEWALFRIEGTPFAISDSGNNDLEYFIIED